MNTMWWKVLCFVCKLLQLEPTFTYNAVQAKNSNLPSRKTLSVAIQLNDPSRASWIDQTQVSSFD